jgi:sulfur-oxidizing protein SoxZ
METGLRLNELDDWIRQRIISSFTCAYGGTPLFRARLYPSVAANPFFEFHCRATQDAMLDFAWYDTQDLTFMNQTRLKLA